MTAMSTMANFWIEKKEHRNTTRLKRPVLYKGYKGLNVAARPPEGGPA